MAFPNPHHGPAFMIEQGRFHAAMQASNLCFDWIKDAFGCKHGDDDLAHRKRPLDCSQHLHRVAEQGPALEPWIVLEPTPYGDTTKIEIRGEHADHSLNMGGVGSERFAFRAISLDFAADLGVQFDQGGEYVLAAFHSPKVAAAPSESFRELRHNTAIKRY
jgi:hypothetical protein